MSIQTRIAILEKMKANIVVDLYELQIEAINATGMRRIRVESAIEYAKQEIKNAEIEIKKLKGQVG